MTEWVEVKPEGKVLTWTLVNTKYDGQVKEPPYIVATIQLAGADCGFHHFIGGIELADIKKVRRTLKTGAKVKAVWRSGKNGNIADIEYFAPIR